jgi:hypothetical protein
MGLRAQDGRNRLAALASAWARICYEVVWSLRPTAGAANSGQFSPPDPCKPHGLLRISRKNLISEFSRVKVTSAYASSP